MGALSIGARPPLRSAEKLSVVLFQFAPWFVFRRSSLDLIAACAERLPGDRIAVECRNKSWFAERHVDETIAFEREHGLIHVVVDEPQGFPSGVPAVWESTSPDLAIVRLHGRNRATWAKKGISAAERFNYLVLKSGCRVEQLQLETRERLEPAPAFYMIIARRVLYLTMFGRDCPEMPCNTVFADEEWKAAYLVTQRKPPPEQPPSLDTMVRMVATPWGIPQPKKRWISRPENALDRSTTYPRFRAHT